MSGTHPMHSQHDGLSHNGGATRDPIDGSWSHTLLVSSPILLIGISSILATYLPYDAWQVLLGVGLLFVLFAAFGLAWIKGFPRWSYPYVIPIFGVAALGVVMAMVTGELLNLVVPLVFLITVSAAIWLSGLSNPVRQLMHGIWQDWTLLAFGMYGLLGMAISLVFDDAHYNNETPYYALAILAGVTGAILYLRTTQAWQRMAALLGGATIVVLMGALDQAHFHDEQLFVFQSQGWMLHFWLLLLIVISLPALLVALVHRHFSVR